MVKNKAVQPVVNIGLVGHVDHGKTTLVKALSGKWTDTHSEEIKRGITIRLGYADAAFYKCQKCNEFSNSETCECGGKADFLRKVSFVDAPGHESLMATMLSGATIMDGALLLVSATEKCPQPQTKEHLMALKISGIKKIIVVQNKIDLVSEEKAIENYNDIKEFLKGTDYEDAPIIPISARQRVNLDVLIQTIEDIIPTPDRDLTKDPLMLIARSFDVNKPGTKIKDISGSVLGGALQQGKLSVGDEIEISPGRKVEKGGKTTWKSISTKITSIMTGGEKVDSIQPGGSVALLTTLDPSVAKADSLTGSVIGLPGKLPPQWDALDIEVNLLDRVEGAKEEVKVDPIKLREALMLNVNAAATVGVVSEFKKGSIKCVLKLPVCADVGSKVTISRLVGNRFRLIGYGIIKK